MKKKLVCLLVISIILNVFSIVRASVPADFTGDRFFKYPIAPEPEPKKDNEREGTPPPLKALRIKLKERRDTKEARMEAKEKRKAVKKALKDYKKNKNFNEANLDIPTDKDIEHLEMAGVEEMKSPQRIIITCDDMDYSTQTAILNANGNVKVKFVQENVTMTTDHLLFDKKSNHITAVGNIVINRDGVEVKGESISVDLNEENALIDHPLTSTSQISISAEKGYVYPNKVVQEKGTIEIETDEPIILHANGKAPQLHRMMVKAEDKSSYETMLGTDPSFVIKVSQIIINSDKKLQSLELKKASIYKNNRKILVLPWIRLYTNKNHDFVDGDFPEIGSRSQLGMFAGPGWVLKMPFGSILKIAPLVTYRDKFGIGGIARFMSGTNKTELAYGTSKSKIVLHGEQLLDDNLKIEYGIHEYLDEWFLGRRMPKYGINLVYEKDYRLKDFIAKGLDLTYAHNASLGFYKDMDKDDYFKKFKGDNKSTIRMRYMAEVVQSLYKYHDEKNLFDLDISLVGQGSVALYGTGDTQVIGRIGPRVHTQYKRWMQDIGYTQSAYQDETPMPVFDAYRYTRSSFYLREYWRVCRYLTLSWMGSVSFSDDKQYSGLFQECSFFASVGPDDFKVNIGYDLIRDSAYFNFSFSLDQKHTTIQYDRLEVKNPENFNIQPKKTSYFVTEPTPVEKTPKILKQAIVEEVSEYDNEDDGL